MVSCVLRIERRAIVPSAQTQFGTIDHANVSFNTDSPEAIASANNSELPFVSDSAISQCPGDSGLWIIQSTFAEARRDTQIESRERGAINISMTFRNPPTSRGDSSGREYFTPATHLRPAGLSFSVPRNLSRTFPEI